MRIDLRAKTSPALEALVFQLLVHRIEFGYRYLDNVRLDFPIDMMIGRRRGMRDDLDPVEFSVDIEDEEFAVWLKLKFS